MRNKGQIWSYDILTAVVVFIITFAFLIFFWWSVATTTGGPRAELLVVGARDFSDVLLSPGNPSDWDGTVDPGDVDTWIGISLPGMSEAFGSQEISPAKAEMLVRMNATSYDVLRQKFRTNYNFHVEVMEFYNCSSPSMVNSPINCTGRGISPGTTEWNSMEHFARTPAGNFTFGLDPSESGARSVSVMNRYAIYNKSLVMVKVVLWTNQTWQ